MKLKCIGGMCHGQTSNIDSYLKTGDQVRVLRNIEMSAIDFMNSKIPDNITKPYDYYKIEAIHFSSKENYIKFLIPVDWKVEQALSILLLPE